MRILCIHFREHPCLLRVKDMLTYACCTLPVTQPLSVKSRVGQISLSHAHLVAHCKYAVLYRAWDLAGLWSFCSSLKAVLPQCLCKHVSVNETCQHRSHRALRPRHLASVDARFSEVPFRHRFGYAANSTRSRRHWTHRRQLEKHMGDPRGLFILLFRPRLWSANPEWPRIAIHCL